MAMEVETSVPTKRMSEMFRALAHRNYRLFWSGAFLSNTGTWMQAVAQGLLVLKLKNSPFWLGFDGFMVTAPGMVLTLVGGVFGDLLDRKRLLIFTQIGAGLSALTLALLVATGLVQSWMVLVLSFVTGSCMSLAGPSFQAITVDLVGREDLANAIALNSTQFQLSRVIGPTFAAATLSAFGSAGCFLANGLSYVAIVAALARVRFGGSGRAPAEAPSRSTNSPRTFWQDLVNGLRYAQKHPGVRGLLLISAMTSLFGAPYFTMVPLFARDVLRMGDTGVAVMMGTAGAGALCGALLLAFLGNFKSKGLFVLRGALSFAVCLTIFALAARPVLSLLMLFGVGFSLVSFVAVINMLLQELVTDEMRGRVMSMFILSFIGMIPIGNVITGAIAERYGAPHTLAVCGAIITLFITIVYLRNARLRGL